MNSWSGLKRLCRCALSLRFRCFFDVRCSTTLSMQLSSGQLPDELVNAKLTLPLLSYSASHGQHRVCRPFLTCSLGRFIRFVCCTHAIPLKLPLLSWIYESDFCQKVFIKRFCWIAQIHKVKIIRHEHNWPLHAPSAQEPCSRLASVLARGL